MLRCRALYFVSVKYVFTNVKSASFETWIFVLLTQTYVGTYYSNREEICSSANSYDKHCPCERPYVPMSNIFKLLADQEKFTDELFAFVTDPNADNRNDRAIVSVLHEVAPQIVSVAECMIIDGVDERHYVEEYVHAVLNGEGATEL